MNITTTINKTNKRTYSISIDNLTPNEFDYLSKLLSNNYDSNLHDQFKEAFSDDNMTKAEIDGAK